MAAEMGEELSVGDIVDADGTVLVHCFAGCGAADILAAVGMELTDLFPEPVGHHRPAPRRKRIPASKVLAAVSQALTIIVLADSDLRRGMALNDDDRETVDKALAVLNQAQREVGNG